MTVVDTYMYMYIQTAMGIGLTDMTVVDTYMYIQTVVGRTD